MPAAAELLRLVTDLGRNVEQRVALVEAEQRSHEQATEARLQRYEQTQAAQTDRVIDAVKGLAKLEAVPDAIRELRAEMKQELKRVEDKVDAQGQDIETIKDQLATQRTERETKREIWRHGVAFLTWCFEHGWKVIVTGAVIAGAVKMYLPEQVTIAQDATAQAPVRDWPLEIRE